ncbi:hypothetical protein FIT76_04230 [Candidatus Methylopumilus universalis]|uniref:hypothetical protein n=1 Tax=Candidatus Methylopumilus universalis TaxID=2588536 RepID=UPI001120A177|nr:hypothetical protein [Candidatus Methylopumilus universalis]QDC47514.1 hypothetical protein FIT76_04230 [Candidatus Methylopumilus universalis]QDC72047.1 hypothetical protein FIT75_04280 [Candidatus Methylopumilus universalis]
MEHNQNSNVLYSALDSHVRIYADTNRYIAYKINKLSNYQVIQIGCDGNLNTCTSINSRGVGLSEKDRSKVCNNCKAMQKTMHHDVRLYIDKSELNSSKTQFLERLKETILVDRDLSRAINLVFDDIEICKIAFFDWSILFKLGEKIELNNEQIERFLFGVRDLLLIYQSVEDYKYIFKDSQYLFYINGNYSQNTMLRKLLKKNHVKSISIELQPFSDKLFNKICFKKERIKLECEGLSAMPPDDTLIDSISLNEVLQNFRNRFLGKEYNAYTNLKKNEQTVKDINRLRKFTKKFEYVYTYFAHSNDEVIPHQITHNAKNSGHEEFQSQDDYLNWLLKTAIQNSNIGFVVRLHPRMARNKRDGFDSDEHKRVRSILSKGSGIKNILVISGDSKISSYYVIYKSSLIVVGWSTIGLEALALGKRVLSIFPYFGMYPVVKISNQPKFINEIKNFMGLESDFCSPVEKNLALWLSIAYEYQFIKIPVIRIHESICSNFLYVINRLVIFLHISKLWFYIFSWLKIGVLYKDSEFLLNYKHHTLALTEEGVSEMFILHRSIWAKSMKDYEN